MKSYSCCMSSLLNKQKGKCVVRLTLFISTQHPFTRGTADKPMQREKGYMQSTFSPAASCSNRPRVHSVSLSRTHTHSRTLTHMHLSLRYSAPLVLRFINGCALYPLVFAPRQLRHCSDGGGGRVYMCACVWVCQRQRGRERECWTEMEGGVRADRERREKWSGLKHESNWERRRGRTEHPVYFYFLLE